MIYSNVINEVSSIQTWTMYSIKFINDDRGGPLVTISLFALYVEKHSLKLDLCCMMFFFLCAVFVFI